MQQPNRWLAALGVAYPVALFACIRGSPSPSRLAEPDVILFFGVVVPLLAFAALVKAWQNGVPVTWAATLAFPAWLGLVAWSYLYLIAMAVASC